MLGLFIDFGLGLRFCWICFPSADVLFCLQVKEEAGFESEPITLLLVQEQGPQWIRFIFLAKVTGQRSHTLLLIFWRVTGFTLSTTIISFVSYEEAGGFRGASSVPQLQVKVFHMKISRFCRCCCLSFRRKFKESVSSRSGVSSGLLVGQTDSAPAQRARHPSPHRLWTQVCKLG